MFELIGWYSCLAAVIALTGYVSKSFLRFVLDKGAACEQVSCEDVLLLTVAGIYSAVSKAKFAFTSALLVLCIAGFLTNASLFVVLGYSSLAYFLGFFIASSAIDTEALQSALPAEASFAHSVEQGPFQLDLF